MYLLYIAQDQANNAGDHRATILFEDSANNVTNEYHQSSSTEEENDDNQPIMISSRMIQHQPNNRRYNNNSNNLVEKIKLAFSPERRKSTLHKKHNRDEDVRLDRSETVFDMPSTSNSSSPPSSPRVRHSLTLTQTQSRQSIQNAHLNEIIEEGTVIQRDRL
jgi:hypothetical protein